MIHMSDSEHEEWLRDRNVRQTHPTKHIIVGGLQSDSTVDETSATRGDSSDRGDRDEEEEEDDDDESEDTSSAENVTSAA